MSYYNPDSEDAGIEQPTIALFADLGWETLNCYHETFGPLSLLGRETMEEVILPNRLFTSLQRLNPGINTDALRMAQDELSKGRRSMSIVRANHEVYRLLKDGIRVSYKKDGEDEETVETVKLIDWNNPANNDFFLASQFWVAGEFGKKRADLVGFVNGIPLVFVELKASHKKLELAYDKNLTDYKDTIPQLFWYNGVIILSNGAKSKIGSVTAGFEHFADWKKIDDESEPGVISLETMVRGTCSKPKLLDLIENFTLYQEASGGLNKLVGKNHQFLGVNNAIKAVQRIKDNQGKLGVFWHTQGSGKSFSMVFFSQKVLRTLHGNWTFVIITDRDDLDAQIYSNFSSTGAVLEPESAVRADSGQSLKRMLNQEDHRYVFTLIQKFHTEHGQKYEKLSDRSDIIVLTDEAHRSQYDTFARNMRDALPNAAFIGFTGTPLMAGEELTKEVFGEYISIYNFRESVEDANTVPLYYENRIPELQLVNDNLTDDIAKVVENANLSEEQEQKLEQEFAREYHLITREDRLERIAEDIAAHYMGRGVLAKAMVISIDKVTTLRLFDNVQKHWQNALVKRRQELLLADAEQKPELEQRLRYFEETEMAVVVSSSQGEIDDFRKRRIAFGLDKEHEAIKKANPDARGLLDIEFHRKRIVKEDLENKFKASDDPLRIVFVCAMWITGFDVPSCSTIYLDKPMQNHTLMQTIARANRVWRDKQNGLIVDYIGVFRNLQKALAIYGTTKIKDQPTDDKPIHPKDELVEELRQAIAKATEFCLERHVDPAKIRDAKGFEREKLKEDAVNALIAPDEIRRQFLSLASVVQLLYKSLLPDEAATQFGTICNVFKVVAEKIRAEAPVVDISAVMADVEKVLNNSISADGYVMPAVSNDPTRLVDLSQFDFDALRRQFENGQKATEAQKLRSILSLKLAVMVKMNRTRMDFLEEFQKMIEDYNAASSNVEAFFAKLMAFMKKLQEEEMRAIAEKLSEEELVVFDLLTKPNVTLTKQEVTQVKKVAKTLLETLKNEKLVLDWRRQQQTRAAVRVAIETVLDELPAAYTKELYDSKCEAIFQHVYESYAGKGQSVYSVN